MNRILLLIFIPMFFAGCGESDDFTDNPELDPKLVRQFKSRHEGLWLGNCLPGNNTSQRLRWDISSNAEIELSISDYVTGDCGGVAPTVRRKKGFYVVDDLTNNNIGIISVRFAAGSMHLEGDLVDFQTKVNIDGRLAQWTLKTATVLRNGQKTSIGKGDLDELESLILSRNSSPEL